MSSTGPGSLRTRPPSIVELLEARERPLFSFELFPAKDEPQAKQLWQTVRELESLGPDFVSVTYGASGSTRDRTITATEAIAQHTTLRTMAHLTCASQSRDQLRQVIGTYAASGVRHVLAIRGDMPGGPTVPWERHPEGLANATELVEMITELGDFVVGVAAFPDLHPENHDADLDARLLVEKEKAGAGFAITQLFFTPGRYFELVDRVRSMGSQLPLIPGIMPVTRLSQIQRMADLSGADLPPAVVDRLNAGADDAEVRRIGIDLATELCQTLLDAGAPGLHFITMNRSPATREIFARIQQSMSPRAGRGS